MTDFLPEQRMLVGLLAQACQLLGVEQHLTAVVCCVMVEASCRPSLFRTGDISANTGQPSGSLGPFQQKAAWGPTKDRIGLPQRVDGSFDSVPTVKSLIPPLTLFLHGGHDGQRGYLSTSAKRSVPDRIQDVQGSEFDGRDSAHSFAANYRAALPLAVELLRGVELDDVSPQDIRDIIDGTVAKLLATPLRVALVDPRSGRETSGTVKLAQLLGGLGSQANRSLYRVEWARRMLFRL